MSRDRILLSPPDVGQTERDFLLDAFESNWIAPLGPAVDRFEAEFASTVGRSHGAALSSGTAALHLAFRILNIAHGDEVLFPTLTFIATAAPATYLGAVPVFIDAHPDTWTIDPELVCTELSERARRGRLPAAVVTVDLYGQCADYDAIAATCASYGVPLIEDAAEALGATYRDRPAGAFGQLAVFSFNGNKIITTSGGGMLVTDDAATAERVRYLASQARQPAVHYEHTEIGYNYRLSNLLASLGRAQLLSLPQRVERRRRTNARYRAALGDLPGIGFLEDAGYGTSTHWLTCITVEPGAAGVTRDDLCRALDDQGIESRPVWKPLHLQPAFRGARTVGGGVSERLFDTGLCLPSGTTLADADQDKVIEALRAAWGSEN